MDNKHEQKMKPLIEAVWKYSLDDENRPRWRCSNCGKTCHRNPYDKHYCSQCGAEMRTEA